MTLNSNKILTPLNKMIKFNNDFRFYGDRSGLFFDLPEPVIVYLVNLCRGKMTPATGISLDTWQDLYQVLSSQGILPIIYDYFKRVEKDNYPPPFIMEKLKTAYLSGMAKVIACEHQLCHLSRVFRKQHIPFLVIKGLSLGSTIYPSSALRPFSDIDLLVLEDHYPVARKALINAGYIQKNERFPILKALHSDELFVPDKNTGSFPVELHWRLDHLYGIKRHIDYKAIFEDAVDFQLNDGTLKKLSFVDDLIFSSQHLTEHHSREIRLIWIYDICHMLRKGYSKNQICQIKEKCQKWRLNKAVSSAVGLAEVWTGEKPPEELKNLMPDKKESEGWERLMKRHDSLYHYMRCRLPPSLPVPEQIRYMAYFLFPSSGHLKQMYPVKETKSLPYFYLKRLIDIFKGTIKRP